MIEVDARDVLEKYAALVKRHPKGAIGDASDLPYPKHLIKIVLRGMIDRAGTEQHMQEVFKEAYIGLAAFQENLTAEERHASVIMAQIAAAQASGDRASGPPITAEVAKAYTVMTERYGDELMRLAQELKSPPKSN
ncbi:MAG: hypothetical protein ACKVP3_28000 [Hyphomicrobiaceae bacterium]